MGGRGASSTTGSSQNIRDAVEHYVSGEGMWINQHLRGRIEGSTLNGQEQEFLKDLRKATDAKLDSTKTLYRSVDASAIFGNISSMDYENLVGRLAYNDNSSYTKQQTDKLLAGIEGKTIAEKGFMSTTKDYELARDFGDFTGSDKPVVLEITPSKTTKGIDIGKKMPSLESRMGQKEVLLKDGQSYVIDKIGGKDGNIYIKAHLK